MLQHRSNPIAEELLGKNWEFPSDHLPVAVNVSGVRVATWNVLNRIWTSFFSDNLAGVAESSLMTKNKPLNPNSDWTEREETSLDLILKLASSSDILMLQECHSDLVAKLKLPANYRVIDAKQADKPNHIAVIFNTEKLSLQKQEIIFDAYKCKACKPCVILDFLSSNGPSLRLVTSHVPGDPLNPGLPEFFDIIGRNYQRESILIAGGDLNFKQAEISSELRRLSLPSPYFSAEQPTVIDTGRVSKCIDHILVFNPPPATSNIDLTNSLPGLEKYIRILQGGG